MGKEEPPAWLASPTHNALGCFSHEAEEREMGSGPWLGMGGNSCTEPTETSPLPASFSHILRWYLFLFLLFLSVSPSSVSALAGLELLVVLVTAVSLVPGTRRYSNE